MSLIDNNLGERFKQMTSDKKISDRAFAKGVIKRRRVFVKQKLPGVITKKATFLGGVKYINKKADKATKYINDTEKRYQKRKKIIKKLEKKELKKRIKQTLKDKSKRIKHSK